MRLRAALERHRASGSYPRANRGCRSPGFLPPFLQPSPRPSWGRQKTPFDQVKQVRSDPLGTDFSDFGTRLSLIRRGRGCQAGSRPRQPRRHQSKWLRAASRYASSLRSPERSTSLMLPVPLVLLEPSPICSDLSSRDFAGALRRVPGPRRPWGLDLHTSVQRCEVRLVCTPGGRCYGRPPLRGVVAVLHVGPCSPTAVEEWSVPRSPQRRRGAGRMIRTYVRPRDDEGSGGGGAIGATAERLDGGGVSSDFQRLRERDSGRLGSIQGRGSAPSGFQEVVRPALGGDQEDVLAYWVNESRVADFHRAEPVVVAMGSYIRSFDASQVGPPPDGASGMVIGNSGPEWLMDAGTPRERTVPITAGGSWAIQLRLVDPPATHLGQPLTEADPVTVCGLAVAYYRELGHQARVAFPA